MIPFLAEGPGFHAATAEGDTVKDVQIENALGETVSKEGLPGMIAAVTDADGVLAVGSAGVRKAGSDEAFGADDVVHIGSCTKAMTCAMLATLVADGTLEWETTLIAALPGLTDDIHREYHHVTLWQLLTHRARIPANANDWGAHRKMAIAERRLAILKENLREAAATEPEAYHYSNLGYMTAACMAEQSTGQTWEHLMRQRLFAPLGMTSAGFGPPGTPGQTDQPWGHDRVPGRWQPEQFDNVKALGPAGRVHCTIADWSRFLALQLAPSRSRILDCDALARLVEPAGEVAGGWEVVARPWAKGKALYHAGTNTRWWSKVWVAPRLNRAFIVATNSFDDDSGAVCDRINARLVSIDRGCQGDQHA